MRSLALAISTALLVGCGTTHDFVKDVEGKAYDSVAGAITEYCKGKTHKGILGMIARQEALELRREIRQRGKDGPQGPTDQVPLLDDKTAYGAGPVVRIWCDSESVPEDIWPDFIRIKS